jgi:putative ABC transport system substrate-binding protein
MKRREFITLLGGAAAAWPLGARAQPPAMPVIGFLRSTTFGNAQHLVVAFRQGLKEAGFVEGQNVTIEFRSAADLNEPLPALAADLVRRRVAVITGHTPAAQIAQAATAAVPIVFTTGGDPVELGFVASLNQPGGNVTGVTFLSAVLGSKRLELLRLLVPKATTIGMLAHPHTPEAAAERREVQAAALAIGQQLLIQDVGTGHHEMEAAFATFVQRGAGALYAGSGPFMSSNRQRIVALAERHKLPAVYMLRDFAAAGGLMSYAASNADAYRLAGVYTGRILKGEKPADLPVVQPTKFELVINLKTAKTLGLDVPDRLLALADEVIE